MCGIFGVVVEAKTSLSEQNIGDVVSMLFRLSESRGKVWA